MSFLKRLFGVGAPQSAGDSQVGEAIEYQGYTIRATPFAAEGQFQTCGTISREFGGEERQHRFIRADRFASAQDAADMALRKGRQIVDEQGDLMFGADNRPL